MARGRLLRRLYRGGRPARVVAVTNRWWAGVSALGVWPRRLAALEVRGRRSGRTITFPVVLTEYDGERYLVSMLGEHANWVANVRAAAGAARLRHGRREEVRLEEVDPAERAPILRRFLEVAPGARPHCPVDRLAPIEDFQAIAGHYPVFRIRTFHESR